MSPDCQQIRELMDSYLSEELSVETNHVVLRHLETCEACADEVERRQRLRRVLAQSLDIAVDADRVKQRITQSLDRQQRTWLSTARWSGLAAALVAGVAIALWLSKPVDVAAYDDSAENHVACGLAFPPAVTYDAERAARSLSPAYKSIADAIGHTHGPYHVIDAHMCPFKGRDYVHVVLRGDGRTLSLFTERTLRGALPKTPVTTLLASDGRQVHSTSRLGYHVSAIATSEFRVFVVSDQASGSRDVVTNELLLSAVRFVRTLEK
jgi:Putative zinc-finger